MAQPKRVQPWFMLSITQGNLIQLGGLLAGLGLMLQAVRAPKPRQTRLMFARALITYFCNHAIAHWAVGRLGGIHFVGYGVHGTTHASIYPPGMRWFFQHLPLFSARTDPRSLRAAAPQSRIAMYLAGTLFTLITSIGLPWYGSIKHIPKARGLLLGTILWCVPMVLSESFRSGGDFYRAYREVRRREAA